MSTATYTLTLVGVVNRVIIVNNQKNTTIDGNLIEIGEHTVILSGRARLNDDDESDLQRRAQDQDDEVAIRYTGQVVVGPLWERVNQCAFVLAGSSYINWNSDEDDAQSWIIDQQQFDLVDEVGKKRIRLNFRITQRGQKTIFSAINYKVTATGDLANLSEPPPGPEPEPEPDPSPSPSECDKQWGIGDPTPSGEQSDAVGASNVKDGNLNTRWVSPATGSVKPWIQFNRVPYDITPTCRVDGAAHKYKFNVDVSTDGVTWTNVLSNKESTGTTTDFEKYTFQATPARYLKITITESVPGAPTVVAQISEIRVFGNA
jgi:hypothetical protein